MKKKFLYFFKYCFIFLILFFNYAYSADDTITGTQTTREDLQADSTLTIQSGGSLVRCSVDRWSCPLSSPGREKAMSSLGKNQDQVMSPLGTAPAC